MTADAPRSSSGTSDRRAIAAALRDVDAGRSPAEAASLLGMTTRAFEDLRADAAAQRRAKLVARLPLVFRDVDPAAEKAIHEDVSATVTTGDGESLWIGVDEGASLERLTAQRDDEGRIVGYGGHVRFDLHDYFQFPNGRDEEADVEGLAVADGFLWVVGSHSRKRKKPDPVEDDPKTALEKLTTVKSEANRCLLGRIPLVAGDAPGVPTLARAGPAIDGGKKKRLAGSIRLGKRGSQLSALLRKDVHLAPFMAVPSKDNGLDVEGVAVSGDRIFAGLRGPVLRGWAIVVELAFKATGKGRLKLKPFGAGEPLRKHFIDLDGLGVRSLMIDGGDLLVLAGPTMDLDGPVRLYRWRDALGAQASSVVPRANVDRALDLPFGEGCDHAEGATTITLAPGERPRLVIAYDTPARERVIEGGGAYADVFEAPEAI
jgi:hypothetical protein